MNNAKILIKRILYTNKGDIGRIGQEKLLNNNKNFISNLYKNFCIHKKENKEIKEELKAKSAEDSIDNKTNTNYPSTTESNHEDHKHVGEMTVNYENIKGVKTGDSSHYIIQFTCKKCEYRTTRIFTKRSYHHGIVLIRCEGCEGVHLIADNLGWFEDGGVNIEDIIKRKGEEYKKLSVDGLFQLSTKDALEELKNNKI